MASVDNRVVEMTFNNAVFEKKIAETLKSLSKLDSAIANAGGKSGLSGLSKAVNSFSLAPVAAGIEGVSKKFIALSAIGITALTNITNRAVDAGISLGKALSLDQVTAGFQEYELKLGSIQTIMAGTGESMQVVNGYLDELNAYADRTIYSFSDMTSNIGKFTNAGVKLDDAVGAIQGISNAAALAGSSSQQASNAMYNFSQALATGSVKLIDWKSIEIAGLATVGFKDSLLEGAVAAGTLTKAADGTYKTLSGLPVDNMKNFNSTLQEGWLTSEALVTTLNTYSDTSTEIGKAANEAATQVKSLSQLLDTTKEAIGSGWAQSFEIMFGNFEEAKELFTGLSGAIDEMVGNSADNRNQLLQDWKDLGGRAELIEGLRLTFVNLGKIFAPIREAFRDIFPAMTAGRLFDMTVAFRKFAEALEPSGETVKNIKRIFLGFFNVLRVGWEVLSIGAKALGKLVQELTGLGGGGALQFLAEIGDVLANLTADDVINALKKSFDKLGDIFTNPLPYLKDLKDNIVDFFKNLSFPDINFDFLDPLVERFQFLARIGEGVVNFAKNVGQAFKDLYDVISSFYGEIISIFTSVGSDVAGTVSGSDFDAVTDVLSLGLIGAIGLGIKRFMDQGLKIDFGQLNLADQVSRTFEGLTGVLKAMQADIKAGALLKIAGALGVLTLSIVVLSMIDSENLAKALTAMAIGFGQLATAFAIIGKLAFGPKDSAKMIALAIGLGILSGAILLLSFAAKNMAGLNWPEIARGLTATAGLLAMLVTTSIVLNKFGGTLNRAAVQMTGFAVALLLLSIPMKIFAAMSWTEIGKGLGTVAGLLLAVGTAMRAFPKDLATRSAGLMGIALAMLVMSASVKIFSMMSLEELGKGLLGVGVGLQVIARAMAHMPPNMAATGVAVLLIATAMRVLASAIGALSELSWTEIGKGIAAIAGTMFVLSKSMKTLSKIKIGNAVTLFILVKSLEQLSGVIDTFAKIPIPTMVRGIIAMGVAMGSLAIGAQLIQPALPAMLGLGAAFILLGAGVAAFGLGASLAVGAFVQLSTLGPGAAKVLLQSLEALGAALPTLAKGFALGLIEFIKVFLEAAPVLYEGLAELLTGLIGVIIEVLPQIETLITDVLATIIRVVADKAPELIATGLQLLLNLLQGIRDNIAEVTTLVLEIVAQFLAGFAEGIPALTDSLADLIISLFTNVAEAVGKVAGTLMLGVGISFLTGFFDGISSQVSKVWDFITGFIDDVINWFKSGFGIFSPSRVMLELGKDLMLGLINGITKGAIAVTDWFIALPGEVLGWIGNALELLVPFGKDLMKGLFNGVIKIVDLYVKFWFKTLPNTIKGWIGSMFTTLNNIGEGLMKGLWNGIAGFMNDKMIPWFKGLKDKIIGWIGSMFTLLNSAGRNLIIGLWNGIVDKVGWVKDKIKGVADSVLGWVKSGFGIFSPSRETYEIGQYFMEGFGLGVTDGTVPVIKQIEKNSAGIKGALEKSVSEIKQITNEMEGQFAPTIKPVLDLSEVENNSARLTRLLATATPSVSYGQASLIASTRTGVTDISGGQSSGEPTFVQNNYSPKALSTADIYRQTRNQIRLAKEELNIP